MDWINYVFPQNIIHVAQMRVIVEFYSSIQNFYQKEVRTKTLKTEILSEG